MTEQELYDSLLDYIGKKTDLEGAKNVAFMVVGVAELEDNITVGTTIVDPDLPSRVENPPVRRNFSQQVLIHLGESIKEPLSRAVEVAQAFIAATKLVGPDTLLNLIRSSDNPTQFTNRIHEVISKHHD